MEATILNTKDKHNNTQRVKQTNLPDFSHSDKLKTLYAWVEIITHVYSQSTGASICVSDENYSPLLEINAGEDYVNICKTCEKQDEHTKTKGSYFFYHASCKELHSNAIKESTRSGGSYIYTCKMGASFWTSPLYIDGQFSGSLTGSGSSDSKKIKALAEMLLICAMYLSSESESCHVVMKRHAAQQAIISEKLLLLKKQYPNGSVMPEYPMNTEKELLSAIRQGNLELGKQRLDELLSLIFFTNAEQFRQIQYRTIELIILFSRIYTKMGFSVKSIFELNKQYIASITMIPDLVLSSAEDDIVAAGIKEITDILHRILAETIAEVIAFKGMQHALALKKAEQFIQEHIDKKIVLSEIARVSGLSVPYFSTIFKEEMGENFSDYLNRVRTEKAALLLTSTDLTLNKIAKLCGFEDQSWFSKIFKLHSGMSPGRFRNHHGKKAVHIPNVGFSDRYIELIK